MTGLQEVMVMTELRGEVEMTFYSEAQIMTPTIGAGEMVMIIYLMGLLQQEDAIDWSWQRGFYLSIFRLSEMM